MSQPLKFRNLKFLGGFYLFVFIVVCSPLRFTPLSKCHWHFFIYRDAGILLLLITALRLTACTVLFISHPFGVINRGPLHSLLRDEFLPRLIIRWHRCRRTRLLPLKRWARCAAGRGCCRASGIPIRGAGVCSC